MTVRMNILLDDKHKTRVQTLATQINASQSEVIRQALEAFDPAGEQRTEEVGLLLKAMAELSRLQREDARALKGGMQELDQRIHRIETQIGLPQRSATTESVSQLDIKKRDQT